MKAYPEASSRNMYHCRRATSKPKYWYTDSALKSLKAVYGSWAPALNATPDKPRAHTIEMKNITDGQATKNLRKQFTW